MKFYKIRAFILIHISRILSKILFVDIPPLVSVTAIIRKGDEMLFIDLTYLKGLGLPGGMLEKDEEVESGIKREIKEETNLDVVSLKYLWSIASYFKGVPTISIVFEVETTGEVKSSNEGTPFWSIPTKEVLGKLSYDSAKAVMSRYLDR